MATTATTLVGSIDADDWLVTLASMAALKPGDNIVVEQETMRALVVGPGAVAVVYRGARGTAGKPHAGGVAANFGQPTDYGAGVGVTSILQELEAEELAAEQALKDGEKAAEEQAKTEKAAAEQRAEQARAAVKQARADAKAERAERD